LTGWKLEAHKRSSRLDQRKLDSRIREGISGREVSRQLHLSPSAARKLLQRGRKDELTEKLGGALFQVHG
jgi:transposase